MKKPSEYTALLRSLKREWKWLGRCAARYRVQILLYVAVGVLGTLMGLGASVASKFLIDAVVGRESGPAAGAAAALVGLAVLKIIFNAASDRMTALVSTRARNEIRSGVYEHILRARWDEARTYHSGELLNRLEGDVGTVAGGVISYIPSVVARLTQFLGSFAIVFCYDPVMAVLALLSAPVLLLISRYTARMVRKYSTESREMSGKVMSFEQESIQNLQTVKAFDLTDRYNGHFRELLEEYRTMQLSRERFSLRLAVGMSVLGLLISCFCYGWSVWRLWQGTISFGTMTLFLQLAGTLTSSFSALASLAPKAISIATAASRVMEIADLPQERDEDRQAATALGDAAGNCGLRIAAENVGYTYRDGTEPVLKNVSFVIEPGEKAAFVGPSGEGKTTLLRLLLGLMRPQNGRLTVSCPGGEPLDISDSTRRLCSYVPQVSAVFSGTVADNLREVRPEATDEQLREALEAAEAWSFIERAPDGLYAKFGERGTNFSEGQIQRISIARALLRDAPVLIMDEATSALDTETEKRVLRNITEGWPCRTCIIATHRPAVLRACDKVYRLDEKGGLTPENPADGKEQVLEI